MTGISSLSQTQTQIRLIKNQQEMMNLLSIQMATGKKTQRFSGLGVDSIVSQRARANYSTLGTYTKNINNADQRLQSMVRSLDQFKAEARIFSDSLLALSRQGTHQEGDIVYDTNGVAIGMTSGTGDGDLRSLQVTAERLFESMQDLLNAQDGDRYLFGGADTLTKPYEDRGMIDGAMGDLVGRWKGGALTTDGLISGLAARNVADDANAITDTTLGYSAALSAGNVKGVSFRPSAGVEVSYTTLANDEGIRDIMVALAYVKNGALGPIADVVDPDTLAITQNGAPGSTLADMKANFFAVLDSLVTKVSQGMTRVDNTRYTLESVRGHLNKVKDQNTQDQVMFQNIIGDVEDVSTEEVAVKLSLLKIQLDASFSVTAMMQRTSLVNFI